MLEEAPSLLKLATARTVPPGSTSLGPRGQDGADPSSKLGPISGLSPNLPKWPRTYVPPETARNAETNLGTALNKERMGKTAMEKPFFTQERQELDVRETIGMQD
eukprot:TRINITY_DN12112_c0_g1_i1.p1 TRINITY_DN12112_c0_g1~~TRINITY_DN12112_c0_g1_i1.p1  ORF type:complete len:105 (-),score=7.24 TRINITY_DN12112_c0_g1_i1:11-325(-)